MTQGNQSISTSEDSLFPDSLNVQLQRVGMWRMYTCGQPVVLSSNEIDESLELIRKWRFAFAGGNQRTLIQKMFHTHSFIIRLDYFYKPNLGVQLCEIEERPAGMYITSVVNKQFRDPLLNAFAEAERAFKKKIAFCISDERANDSDDQDFTRYFRWGKGAEGGFEPKAIPLVNGVPSPEVASRYVWWVRSLRHEQPYHKLEPFAITSVSQEGDKSYGVELGRWFLIGKDWKQVIPFETGCVLKPRHGSRFEHTLIISSLAQKDGESESGVHRFSRAKEAIESGKVSYWQPLYLPEQPVFLSQIRYKMLRRVYYAYSYERDNYFPLGGMWVANPSYRIHGSSNSLAGPIRLS